VSSGEKVNRNPLFVDSPLTYRLESSRSGFYCFEPDSKGVMKIAIHSNGYQNPVPSKSTSPPVSFQSFGAGEKANSATSSSSLTSASSRSEQFVPADKLERMLSELANIYPDLASAPVKYTRICFYSDSEDENWVIDHLPGVKGLVVASGDSGHAFKVGRPHLINAAPSSFPSFR
jgi:sarcosine oxidase/L-pipecolate oxidase